VVERCVMCRWNEDLRFRLRDSQEIGNAMLKVAVKDAPGSATNLGGSVIGKASVDAAIIIGELDKLRAEALNEGVHLLLERVTSHARRSIIVVVEE
jgi:hypothetical protein